MSRQQRQQRNVKYLLWVLAVLNMVGLYLLRHPEVLKAEARPATTFADTRSVPSPLAPRAA